MSEHEDLNRRLEAALEVIENAAFYLRNSGVELDVSPALIAQLEHKTPKPTEEQVAAAFARLEMRRASREVRDRNELRDEVNTMRARLDEISKLLG